MIQSVFIGDDADLVADILDLHARGPRVLDMTYGHGGFWRGARSSERSVVGLDRRMDTGELDTETRRPAFVSRLMAGDYTALPFPARSFDAVTFDPPFMIRPGSGSRMAERYTGFPTYDDLLRSCAGARDEAYRVLAPGGVAVVKAMDWVEGRTRWRWLHHDLSDLWTERFRQVDLFVSVRPTSLRNPRVETQAHSKRAHTFFLVFRRMQRERSLTRGSTLAADQRVNGSADVGEQLTLRILSVRHPLAGSRAKLASSSRRSTDRAERLRSRTSASATPRASERSR